MPKLSSSPSALAQQLVPAEPEERASSVNDAPESEVRGSALPQEKTVSELSGWFVEADGEPQGPLTEQDLRDRVARGAVDRETLVWRQEAGDWKAAGVVGALSLLWDRASHLGDDEPGAAVDSAAKDVEPAGDQASGQEAEPGDDEASPVAGAADSVSDPGVSTNDDDDDVTVTSSLSELDEQLASMNPSTADDGKAQAEEAAGGILAVAASTSPPLPTPPLRPEPAVAKAPPGFAKSGKPGPRSTAFPFVASIAPIFSVIPSYMPPKAGQTVPAILAWGAACVALLFGVGVGYLIWGATPEIRYVVASDKVPDFTAVAEHAAPPPPTEDSLAKQQAAAVVPQPANVGGRRDLAAAMADNVQSGSGSKGSDTPSPATEVSEVKGGSLLSGLSAGASGPATGSNARTTGGASLTATQIQQSVQRYQPGVRRSCWQQALNGRALGAPNSARVALTIKIAPNGSVTGVSTTGDPNGYPGLSTCIKTRVRSWRFPSASGGTTTKVPFVFAAQ